MKIFAICLDASFLFLLMACTTPISQPKKIHVDENKNNSTVELLVGDQIEISLPGNPTTGYIWEISSIDTSILNQLGEPEYLPGTDQVGAGGKYVFEFEAISSGNTTLELVYHRTFEKNIPPQQMFVIKVSVSK